MNIIRGRFEGRDFIYNKKDNTHQFDGGGLVGEDLHQFHTRLKEYLNSGKEGPSGPDSIKAWADNVDWDNIKTSTPPYGFVSVPKMSEFKQLKKNHDRLVKRVEELESQISILSLRIDGLNDIVSVRMGK